MSKKKTAKPEQYVIRPVDHIVLSLPDLDQARQRFGALGFNVAPVARHNFGTENAIIAFANGTFLEPLAIGDSATVEKHRINGNPFLVRDRAFRFRHGGDKFTGGFSMLAVSGINAGKDRKKFRKAGLRTGKIAIVRRPGLDIRASFALDERAADCTIFACERKDGTPEFEVDLTAHANGALRIARVTLVDNNPADFLEYLETVTGQSEVVESARGLDFKLANAELSILTPEGLKSNYGIDTPRSLAREGLRPVTWDIAVRSLDETAMMLAERGIEARQVGQRIVVANAPGQGAILAFVKDETS